MYNYGDQSWEQVGLTMWGANRFWEMSVTFLSIFFKPKPSSCEELTHWKRLWCREGLGAGAEGDDRGWDGWMASVTRWTGVWVNFGSWWWTGRPGVLRYMGSQRVGHDWAIELNWTELNWICDHGHQVVNFLHLMGGLASVKQLRECAPDTITKVLQWGAEAEEMSGCLPHQGPIRSCFLT